MGKKKRFGRIESNSVDLTSTAAIYLDTETGVQYLLVTSGYGAGLTPLLDEHGAPVIDKSVAVGKDQ